MRTFSVLQLTVFTTVGCNGSDWMWVGIHMVIVDWVGLDKAKWTQWPSLVTHSLSPVAIYIAHWSGSTNWESQCIAVCSTRLVSTWSTALHQSQTFPADVIYGQPLDITWLYHVTGSALSVVGPSLSQVRRSGTCYRGQCPWHGTHQQQLQTIADDEPISSLPLSTHSAVEMLHDSAPYKSIVNIDIDNYHNCMSQHIDSSPNIAPDAQSQRKVVVQLQLCSHVAPSRHVLVAAQASVAAAS